MAQSFLAVCIFFFSSFFIYFVCMYSTCWTKILFVVVSQNALVTEQLQPKRNEFYRHFKVFYSGIFGFCGTLTHTRKQNWIDLLYYEWDFEKFYIVQKKKKNWMSCQMLSFIRKIKWILFTHFTHLNMQSVLIYANYSLNAKHSMNNALPEVHFTLT